MIAPLPIFANITEDHRRGLQRLPAGRIAPDRRWPPSITKWSIRMFLRNLQQRVPTYTLT